MKKIIVLFVCSLLTCSVFSQTKFFVEAGINNSVPAFEGRLLGGSSKDSRVGLTATAGIVNKLGQGFQLNNRLSLITKDFHESFFTGPDNSGQNDYLLSGLQYHLLIEKDLAPKKKLHILPALGVYTTVHTGGKLNYEHSTIAGVVKGFKKLHFDKNGDFSRWDAGLNVSARFQFKRFGLDILYDIGLVKVRPNAKAKWSSVHFTLGYFFK